MEKIVITPLFGMGDTLMTMPALELLKQQHPDCIVTYFTFNTASRSLLQHNPHIDYIWYYPIKTIHFIKGTLHIIKHFTFRFDTCVNFYPSNRADYNLFALLTGAKNRIGHTYGAMNISQLNWLKNKTIAEECSAHCVKENVRLLKFWDIAIPDEKIPPMRIYLTDEEKNIGKTYRDSINTGIVVGVHPGTSSFKNQAHRRWPKEKFVEFINNHPDVHFLLFGTSDEISVNAYIRSTVKDKDRITVITGKSIREVAAIIGACNAFVSNDSGLMHIAAAMGVPTVAILGPTNQDFIHPWHVPHEIVRLDLPCSPCFYYSPKPLRCRLNNSFACLVDLEAEKISQALNKLLYTK